MVATTAARCWISPQIAMLSVVVQSRIIEIVEVRRTAIPVLSLERMGQACLPCSEGGLVVGALNSERFDGLPLALATELANSHLRGAALDC